MVVTAAMVTAATPAIDQATQAGAHQATTTALRLGPLGTAQATRPATPPATQPVTRTQVATAHVTHLATPTTGVATKQ